MQSGKIEKKDLEEAIKKLKGGVIERNKQSDYEGALERIKIVEDSKCGKCITPECYINNNSMLIWYCERCDGYWQSLFSNMFNRGTWCVWCYENKYINYLDLLKTIIQKLTNKLFVSKSVDNFILSCYNDELNINIEFYDINHYKSIEILKPTYEELQLVDIRRKQYCQDNNIKLVIISYDDRIKGNTYIKQKIYSNLEVNLSDELDNWLKDDSIGKWNPPLEIITLEIYKTLSKDKQNKYNMQKMMGNKFKFKDENIVIDKETTAIILVSTIDEFKFEMETNIKKFKSGNGYIWNKKHIDWPQDRIIKWYTTIDPNVNINSIKYNNGKSLKISYYCKICNKITGESVSDINRRLFNNKNKICSC